MAWFASPLSARCRAMRFDRGTVDQNLRRRPAGLSERMEQLDPHAFLRPAGEAVVERRPGPVLGWRIDPATARFQHADDAADHAPIIDARFAARIGRQVRLDLRKLRVRKRELIPIHRRFLSEAVNHKRLLTPTLLWVRTPSGLQSANHLASNSGNLFRRY